MTSRTVVFKITPQISCKHAKLPRCEPSKCDQKETVHVEDTHQSMGRTPHHSMGRMPISPWGEAYQSMGRTSISPWGEYPSVHGEDSPSVYGEDSPLALGRTLHQSMERIPHQSMRRIPHQSSTYSSAWWESVQDKANRKSLYMAACPLLCLVLHHALGFSPHLSNAFILRGTSYHVSDGRMREVASGHCVA